MVDFESYGTKSTKNMIDIANASDGKFSLISNSFRFGYVQGMKAAKAEMKRMDKMKI